jgi:diguanylate cyclase (GGDEF)-like protein/PAS domain S-box-containing protein
VKVPAGVARATGLAGTGAWSDASLGRWTGWRDALLGRWKAQPDTSLGSWLAVALVLGLAVTLLDLAIDSVLIGLLVVAPLAACMRATVEQTALVAVSAFALAIVLGLPNGIFGEVDHLIRASIVLLVGALSAAIAALRMARERAVAEAHASEARRAAILESAPDSVITIDASRRVLEFNRAAERTLGYSREQALGREMSELIIPPRLRVRHWAELLRHLRGGRPGTVGERVETTAMRADGREFPAELTITRVDGTEPPLFTCFLRDITERRRFEERLAREAMHDALTGLPNRTLFMDRLALATRRLRRSDSMAAVLFLDVDRFKAVNDALGHASGDELLTEMARRCAEVIRPGDTLARISGDEFTALCEGLGGEAEAVGIAERLKQAIEAPVWLAGREVHTSASIGIALAAGDTTPESLLSDADAAMYRAKQQGRGRCRLFDGQMRASEEPLRREEALREAIRLGQLEVHYQLQVDLRTHEAVGAEALVRWRHPRRGVIGPDQFIPLAEETDLIVPLGDVVLEQACRQAQRWSEGRPDQPPLSVAVNLSATQFASPELPARVQATLERAGLAADWLCLEITESALMGSAIATAGTLSALSAMGVRLAIDDFGTGYSSLGYLRRLPVDVIKVDRSFIEGLGSRSDDQAIVSAVVSMGHALGLSVLAEGIETREQLDELRELGCDLGQGFGFARPRPPEEIDELLTPNRCFELEPALG